jgi:hypothetical protein
MNRSNLIPALAVAALAGGILALAPTPGNKAGTVSAIGNTVIAPVHAQDGPSIGTPAPASSGLANGEIDWLDLMPPEDLEAIKNLPPIDHDGFLAADQFMSFNTVPRFDGL